MTDLFPPATPIPIDDSELLLDHLSDKYEALLKFDRDASFDELLSEIDTPLVPSLFQELTSPSACLSDIGWQPSIDITYLHKVSKLRRSHS